MRLTLFMLVSVCLLMLYHTNHEITTSSFDQQIGSLRNDVFDAKKEAREALEMALRLQEDMNKTKTELMTAVVLQQQQQQQQQLLGAKSQAVPNTYQIYPKRSEDASKVDPSSPLFTCTLVLTAFGTTHHNDFAPLRGSLESILTTSSLAHK